MLLGTVFDRLLFGFAFDFGPRNGLLRVAGRPWVLGLGAPVWQSLGPRNQNGPELRECYEYNGEDYESEFQPTASRA